MRDLSFIRNARERQFSESTHPILSIIGSIPLLPVSLACFAIAVGLSVELWRRPRRRGVMISPGISIRVRACCKLCPGRVGVVSHCLPGANPKNPTPRTEILWGDELEPLQDGAA